MRIVTVYQYGRRDRSVRSYDCVYSTRIRDESVGADGASLVANVVSR